MSQPKARKGATDLTPEAFLATYPPAVAALAEALRQLVKASVPTVAEAVYPGWKLIGYRLLDRPGGRYFCFIAPLVDEVRLGFEYGVELQPHRLLEGSGTQVRYVPVRSAEMIDPEQLAPLIAEAAMVAATRGRR
jgi:hypothetical protein